MTQQRDAKQVTWKTLATSQDGVTVVMLVTENYFCHRLAVVAVLPKQPLRMLPDELLLPDERHSTVTTTVTAVMASSKTSVTSVTAVTEMAVTDVTFRTMAMNPDVVKYLKVPSLTTRRLPELQQGLHPGKIRAGVVPERNLVEEVREVPVLACH